jgi:1-acyl-sn-glycerol-3-phosphate acyltransferase
VRAFQDGAFRLAIEAGVPVLPLAIDGTRDALPRRGWIFGPVNCRLHVFPPVETIGLTPASASELRARVRADIIEKVAAWRGVDPSAVDGDAGPGVEEGANSRPLP